MSRIRENQIIGVEIVPPNPFLDNRMEHTVFSWATFNTEGRPICYNWVCSCDPKLSTNYMNQVDWDSFAEQDQTGLIKQLLDSLG
jgi:hypothetical protein